MKNIDTNLGRNLALTALVALPMLAISNANANEKSAQQKEQDQTCLMEKLASASGQTLIAEIREECEIEVQGSDDKGGAISKRIVGESKTKHNPYVLTPHRMNYILPVSYSDGMNTKVYSEQAPDSGWAENLEDHESKYQISIKAPLNYGDIFTEGDGIYVAMTLQSWWQVYSDGISKPFRETNYQPEIFYLGGLDWHPFEGNTGYMLGIEHQSNGRSTAISRSWNRVYANFLFEKGDFAFSFKPWYRLEEDEKEYIGDPEGDDNPDIMDYMGYFQTSMAYKYENIEFSMMLRDNFATHKGAVELGMTFPLWGRLRGYVQAFSGYGESLIDYNHNQNRIGVGIALNNVL